MRIFVRVFTATAMLSAFVATATADTHVVEIANVQPGIFYVLDLGAELGGISEVTIRAVGVGGRGLYECVAPAVGGWYNLDYRICFGVGCIEFPTLHQAMFDVSAVATVDEGSWQVCEGVSRCPVTVSFVPHGLADYRRHCGLAQRELLPVSRLVITINADTVVGTEGRSWGSIKAMYRH